MPKNVITQSPARAVTECATASTSTPLIPIHGVYQSDAALRAELILGPTEPFRKLIEQYLATVVPNYYKPATLIQVRTSIGKFFRFVAQDLHIVDLDQIRPSTISRFIERERGRGLTSFNFIGHISSFFVWLISLELYDRGNPVIARLHRPKMTKQLGSIAPSR